MPTQAGETVNVAGDYDDDIMRPSTLEQATHLADAIRSIHTFVNTTDVDEKYTKDKFVSYIEPDMSYSGSSSSRRSSSIRLDNGSQRPLSGATQSPRPDPPRQEAANNSANIPQGDPTKENGERRAMQAEELQQKKLEAQQVANTRNWEATESAWQSLWEIFEGVQDMPEVTSSELLEKFNAFTEQLEQTEPDQTERERVYSTIINGLSTSDENPGLQELSILISAKSYGGPINESDMKAALSRIRKAQPEPQPSSQTSQTRLLRNDGVQSSETKQEDSTNNQAITRDIPKEGNRSPKSRNESSSSVLDYFEFDASASRDIPLVPLDSVRPFDKRAIEESQERLAREAKQEADKAKRQEQDKINQLWKSVHNPSKGNQLDQVLNKFTSIFRSDDSYSTDEAFQVLTKYYGVLRKLRTRAEKLQEIIAALKKWGELKDTARTDYEKGGLNFLYQFLQDERGVLQSGRSDITIISKKYFDDLAELRWSDIQRDRFITLKQNATQKFQGLLDEFKGIYQSETVNHGFQQLEQFNDYVASLNAITDSKNRKQVIKDHLKSIPEDNSGLSELEQDGFNLLADLLNWVLNHEASIPKLDVRSFETYMRPSIDKRNNQKREAAEKTMTIRERDLMNYVRNEDSLDFETLRTKLNAYVDSLNAEAVSTLSYDIVQEHITVFGNELKEARAYKTPTDRIQILLNVFRLLKSECQNGRSFEYVTREKVEDIVLTPSNQGQQNSATQDSASSQQPKPQSANEGSPSIPKPASSVEAALSTQESQPSQHSRIISDQTDKQLEETLNRTTSQFINLFEHYLTENKSDERRPIFQTIVSLQQNLGPDLDKVSAQKVLREKKEDLINAVTGERGRGKIPSIIDGKRAHARLIEEQLDELDSCGDMKCSLWVPSEEDIKRIYEETVRARPQRQPLPPQTQQEPISQIATSEHGSIHSRGSRHEFQDDDPKQQAGQPSDQSSRSSGSQSNLPQEPSVQGKPLQGALPNTLGIDKDSERGESQNVTGIDTAFLEPIKKIFLKVLSGESNDPISVKTMKVIQKPLQEWFQKELGKLTTKEEIITFLDNSVRRFRNPLAYDLGNSVASTYDVLATRMTHLFMAECLETRRRKLRLKRMTPSEAKTSNLKGKELLDLLNDVYIKSTGLNSILFEPIFDAIEDLRNEQSQDMTGKNTHSADEAFRARRRERALLKQLNVVLTYQLERIRQSQHPKTIGDFQTYLQKLVREKAKTPELPNVFRTYALLQYRLKQLQEAQSTEQAPPLLPRTIVYHFLTKENLTPDSIDQDVNRL